MKGNILGGWETFGIENAFNTVLDPSFFTARDDPANSHVGVVDPDGTIGSVGIPQGADNDPTIISRLSQRYHVFFPTPNVNPIESLRRLPVPYLHMHQTFPHTWSSLSRALDLGVLAIR